MPRQNSRIVVDPLRAPELQPRASPADTFTRTDGGRNLAALARGLAEISPAVGQLAGLVADRTLQEQTLAGEMMARKLNEQGLSLAQATREGKIPKGLNPWFRAGLDEQFGRVTADRWQSDFMAAAGADEVLKESTNIQDFDAFAQKHLEGWSQENIGDGRGEHFERGFGHRRDAYVADERRKFAARIEGKLENQSNEAHFAEIKRGVIDSFARGLTPEQIAADINSLNTAALAQGRNGTQVNQTTVRALIGAAMESENGLEVLELLKRVQGGSGALGDTTYGTQAYQKAREEIIERSWRNEQRDRAHTEFAREQNLRDTLGSAVELLQSNHFADLSPLLGRLKDSPEAAAQLLTLQRNMAGLKFRTDENVKRDLYARIWTVSDGIERVSEQTVIGYLNAARLTTEDAAWLVGQMRAARDAREGDQKGVFDDFLFRQELNNLRSRFTDKMTGLIAGETADRAAQAEAMFTERWVLLNKSGESQKMTQEQRLVWLNDQAASIVKLQRGADPNEFNPAPAPAFQSLKDAEAKFPQDLVLDEADLRMALNGENTQRLQATLQRLGLTQPSEIGAFLRSQVAIFSKKTGRTQPRSSQEMKAETPPEGN